MNKKSLVSTKIAFLGGDRREVELISILVAAGATLEIIGQPPVISSEQIVRLNNLKEVKADIDVVIAPMTGTDQDLKIKKTFTSKDIILNEEFFAKLKAGTKFFIGFAKPQIKAWCKKYQIDLIELAALDEIAILNAIPTAEGAIEIAMRESTITLHNNSSFVLGLGRVGITMARMLKALGSKTYGVARKAKDLARALEMGFNPVDFNDLADEIKKADFIFNTVPVLILNRALLQEVKSEAIIIDLASSPGGTDFEVAKELGVKAELALGLPGKVAPKSAGQILGKVIPRLILSEE